MKKALLVISALVMALTMVLGSVTTASAAPPAKTPSINLTITRVDVAAQTIYYTASWKNLPSEMAVSGFIVRFYPNDGTNGTETINSQIAVSSKSFNKAKTSYTSPEMSAVTLPGQTFQSGEYILGTLDLRDANEGSILSYPYQTSFYLVP